MKRLKYMYSMQRTKKQKDHQSLPSKIEKNQHIQSIKTQAVKTLYSIEQDYLAKTQLNITFRNSEISLKNQYKRRSLSQKQNLRKTITTSFSQQKTKKDMKFNIKQHTYEPHNINIKKLLRIKTESLHQEQNDKLLRNPFYKIQKTRQLNTLISKKNDAKQLQIQKEKELNQSTHKKPQQNDKQFLVSRDKKQWYFASKKYRLRTIQHDQALSAINTNQMIKNQLNENFDSLSKTPSIFYKKQPSSNHLRNPSTSSSDFGSPNTVLQFNKMESIMYEDQNPIIIQQSRQQSPAKIRQKSLTVKYNQIKDYFEKKYQYKNQNQLDQSFINQFNEHD